MGFFLCVNIAFLNRVEIYVFDLSLIQGEASMYIFFNANPTAQRVGDCTIRAISTATGKTWEEVFIGVCVYGLRLHDMPSANRVWGDYLESLGWKREMIQQRGYTVADFAKDHKKGAYILAISGHVVACVDGNCIDTWDSTQEIVVYFWRTAND